MLAEGASQDVGCEIRFQVREPWPDGSFSLLWRGTRVRGFDVTGPGPGESLLVSDGGYTLSQLGLYVRSVAAMRERQRDLERIAHELMLDWRGEFYATASDLKDALRRVSVIGLAVGRALSLLRPRPSRVRPPLRAQFEKDLQHADIRMYRDARIAVGPEQHPVLVDYRLVKNGREAAVELLAGRTQQGAASAVDHTIANFNVLHRSGYHGLLAAVYDEESTASQPRLIERFQSGTPEGTLLLPGSRAAGVLRERLVA